MGRKITDVLAEINGIKPDTLLKDGKQKPVMSRSTGHYVYRIRRQGNSYDCNCPAWKGQIAAHDNARSCKHMKYLFGEDYEKERVEFEKARALDADNEDEGSDAKPPTNNLTRKRKRSSKQEDSSDSESKKTTKKARKPSSTPKGKGRATAPSEADDENDDDDGASGSKSLRTKRQQASPKKANTAPSWKGAPPVLLAKKWDLDDGIDPTGWWISEKLDGVRTWFDGQRFYSRLGNLFTPPGWFLEGLPKGVVLDGEIFTERQEFQKTVSIVKTASSPRWKDVTFQIFDLPSQGHLPFERRMEELDKLFGEDGTHASERFEVVRQVKAKSREHVFEMLQEVEELGGEGLMLRKPTSKYEGSRSSTLLKVKTFYDAEAIVTGHKLGSGKNSAVTGALCCKMACGKIFHVGSGLTDKQRKCPPKIGSIITYRFQELTKDGMPRFPTFVGEAIDKKVPKDADLPAARRGKQDTDD